MHPIPLINAEHVARVADMLDANGIPADRYFERARISPALREHPSGFVPGKCVWAVERLQERPTTVREIAEELGYTSAAHFTRFFRTRAGVPPSAYRDGGGRDPVQGDFKPRADGLSPGRAVRHPGARLRAQMGLPGDDGWGD